MTLRTNGLTGLSLSALLALSLGNMHCAPAEEVDASVADSSATGTDSSTQQDAASGDDAGILSDATSGQDSAVMTDANGTDSSTVTDAATTVTDAARRDAGPGGITIYDIRNPASPSHPAVDSIVSLSGVVVTGIDLRPSTTGFWVQEPSGGAFSGIFVFAYADNTVLPLDSLSVGDIVSLTGQYQEFYDLSELDINQGSASITGHQDPLAAAEPADINTTTEPWEGVLVNFAGPCTVTAAANDYGQVATSCFLIDDDAFDYGDSLSVGQELSHITGLITFGFSEYKILPRDGADLGLDAMTDAGVSSDSGTSTGCGDVTYQGQCNGDSITYCLDGELYTEDCVEQYGSDATCGLLDCTTADCMGYYCIAKPGGACIEIDCDLTHGCINGVCTESSACDETYDDVCVVDSTRLSYCNPFSNLINEQDCALDWFGDAAPFVCGEHSQGFDACLGTVGEYNCDMSSDPTEECVAGLVCSSEVDVGNCTDPNATDAGVVVSDAGAADQGTVENDAAVNDSAVSDAAVNDAVVNDAAVVDSTVGDPDAGVVDSGSPDVL